MSTKLSNQTHSFIKSSKLFTLGFITAMLVFGCSDSEISGLKAELQKVKDDSKSLPVVELSPTAEISASSTSTKTLLEQNIESQEIDPLKSFETKVLPKYVKFFKEQPFLVYKQDMRTIDTALSVELGSILEPRNIAIVIRKYTLNKSDFDVVKTDSLASPFNFPLPANVKFLLLKFHT